MKKCTRICFWFICFGCVILLSGCAKQVSVGTVPSNDVDKPVTGAAEYDYTYCVTEHGMLYPSGHLIRYYDLETDQAYILCDKANCSHGDERCGAWYDNMASPKGVAIYKDACYLFRTNVSKNTIEFVSMDLTGNNQKVITQLEMGTLDEEGGWQLNSIGDIYYVKDMVWFYTDYIYYTEEGVMAPKRIYSGIRLSDGSKIALEEPGHEEDSEMIYLKMVTNDYLVFNQQCHGSPMLTKDEFAQECEKGTFGDFFEDSEDPYYDYYRRWYPYHNDQTERIFIYELDAEEMYLLEELPTSFSINKDGTLGTATSNYVFFGEYEGKLLCDEPDWENDRSLIFLWNIETNTKTELPWAGEDGTMYYGQTLCDNCVIDGTYIFPVKKTGEYAYDVFWLNLDTQELSPKIGELGEDNFHLIADTPDMFIGEMPPASIAGYVGGNPYTLYKISKKDYYNGDWSKVTKLHL